MDILSKLDKIKPLDNNAIKLAEERQNNLYKPVGSLGVLEDISIRLAGITGNIYNNINKKILFLFGADNGIYEENISGSPQEFTKHLIESYADNLNCAINVICKSYNVDLKIINMGVKDCNHSLIDNHNLMNGTFNFLKRKAIPEDIVLKAINIGAEYSKYAKDNGYNIIGNGEVGMANTTTATACILASLGYKEVESFVGRGAGLSDEAFIKKKRVIEEALNIYNLDKNNSIEIISSVGGLDIAGMVGLYLGAAYYRIPIIIDGLISVAAALLAYRISPLTKNFMIPSHLSEEPAYNIAINEIGLTPMLHLNMRLGEGSGCPIAMNIVETSCNIINNMITFKEKMVSQDYRKKLKMK